MIDPGTDEQILDPYAHYAYTNMQELMTRYCTKERT